MGRKRFNLISDYLTVFKKEIKRLKIEIKNISYLSIVISFILYISKMIMK